MPRIRRPYRLNGAGGPAGACPIGLLGNFNLSDQSIAEAVDGTPCTAFMPTFAGVNTVFTWQTIPGNPGIMDWTGGPPGSAIYLSSVEVSEWPTGAFGRIDVTRRTAGCVEIVRTTDLGFFAAPTVYTTPSVADPTPDGDSSDIICVELLAFFPSGTPGNVTVVPTVDSFHYGPYRPANQGIPANDIASSTFSPLIGM